APRPQVSDLSCLWVHPDRRRPSAWLSAWLSEYVASSQSIFQQRPSLDQVGGVESLGERTHHRLEIAIALLRAAAGQADLCAQLPPALSLASGQRNRASEA